MVLDLWQEMPIAWPIGSLGSQNERTVGPSAPANPVRVQHPGHQVTTLERVADSTTLQEASSRL